MHVYLIQFSFQLKNIFIILYFIIPKFNLNLIFRHPSPSIIIKSILIIISLFYFPQTQFPFIGPFYTHLPITDTQSPPSIYYTFNLNHSIILETMLYHYSIYYSLSIIPSPILKNFISFFYIEALFLFYPSPSSHFKFTISTIIQGAGPHSPIKA